MVEAVTRAVRVIVPRDMKNPSKKIPASRGMHVTIIMCVSADGTFITPTFILPLKHFPEDCTSLAHRYHWAGQEEGWITEGIFSDWILKVFLPFVNRRRQLMNVPEQPVLLWVDGQSSRGSPTALQALIDNKVTLATIPSC